MGGNEQRDQRLFSYGTLRQENVQLALFGRPLDGEPDSVTGYILSTVTIEDPDVVGQSGIETHPILVAADDPALEVTGTVYLLSAAELAAADDYEVSPYVRVEAPLRSGGVAWVYVMGVREGA
jgi:gamma-glutamylcyclotransferase (GGCT)/AIG2-like uncharacterized protein YtfP